MSYSALHTEKRVSCYCFKESLLKIPSYRDMSFPQIATIWEDHWKYRLSQIYKGRELSDVNLSSIYSIWLTLANRISIFQNKDSRIFSFSLETTLKYYGIYYKLSNTLAWFAHSLRKNFIFYHFMGASLIAQLVMNPPVMQETLVRFLRREDPLEK